MAGIDRRGWSPEERAEYELLVSEVVAATTNTHARLDLFERKLNDAVQAHRPWAREVERSCLREGAAKEIKRHEDRNRAMVSHNGRLLNLPKVQGTRARTEDGATYEQRELIELWSWEQIAKKRAEALRMRRCYDDKIAHYDKLLALRDMCPKSKSPADACTHLGLTLDAYLAVEAA